MTHSHSDIPERPLPEFNTMQKIKRRFFALRNGMLAARQRAAGLHYGVNFGLNIPQIKDTAAEVRGWGLTPAELMALSEELWNNATTRESRLLAPMLVPEGAIPSDLAARWLAEAQTTEVADHLCHSLLRKLPDAFRMAANLSGSQDATEIQLYSALRLLLNLMCIGKADAQSVADAAEPLRNRDSALLRPLLLQIDQELAFLAEEDEEATI